mmetsp:Transcript_22492/g.50681  ORF Transcript_22492/g.50681 Transcript_22492/m.50681 type:complete len:307 (+) Transcript_22492:968-1888(+)
MIGNVYLESQRCQHCLQRRPHENFSCRPPAFHCFQCRLQGVHGEDQHSLVQSLVHTLLTTCLSFQQRRTPRTRETLVLASRWREGSSLADGAWRSAIFALVSFLAQACCVEEHTAPRARHDWGNGGADGPRDREVANEKGRARRVIVEEKGKRLRRAPETLSSNPQTLQTFMQIRRQRNGRVEQIGVEEQTNRNDRHNHEHEQKVRTMLARLLHGVHELSISWDNYGVGPNFQRSPAYSLYMSTVCVPLTAIICSSFLASCSSAATTSSPSSSSSSFLSSWISSPLTTSFFLLSTMRLLVPSPTDE